MKLAIISTTINGEKGYLPFDKLAKKSKFDEVVFVISGDLKTPGFDTSKFSCPVEYLSVDDQKKYECSEPMGWNKIMRRNIALLRAIEHKPDYILLIDDDNLPEKDYFDRWYALLTKPAKKVASASSKKGEVAWHNYLRSSDAKIDMHPRGFPVMFKYKSKVTIKDSKPIDPKNIGAFQGISLGDADIDAMTRIVYPDKISKIKEKNYCLKDVWSPYNTQNTLISKELFPLAFVWPFCGRYDDIYSSYVWQQFLFNKGMYVHVGDAINFQDRGIRNNLKDLANETEGYLNAHLVWERIRKIQSTDPIEFLEELIKVDDNEIIKRQRPFMAAFLKDLKKIKF